MHNSESLLIDTFDGQFTIGKTSSITVIVNVSEKVSPFTSVISYSKVVVPDGNESPLVKPVLSIWVIDATPQLSLPVTL